MSPLNLLVQISVDLLILQSHVNGAGLHSVLAGQTSLAYCSQALKTSTFKSFNESLSITNNVSIPSATGVPSSAVSSSISLTKAKRKKLFSLMMEHFFGLCFSG